MNPLVTLYKSILESLDCVVKDNGEVYYTPDESEGKPLQITINGVARRVLVPFDNVVDADINFSKVVMFHPACESIFGNQSEVLNLLVDLVSLKLYRGVSYLAIATVDLAMLDEVHSKLKMKQVEYLQETVPTANATTMKYMAKLASATTGVTGGKKMLSIRLRKSAKIDTVEFNRVAKIIPHVIAKEDVDPFGVKPPSAKVAQHIRNLYTYLIPRVEAGSNDKVAPFFRVVLNVYYKSAIHQNDIKNLLGKYCGSAKLIETEWFSGAHQTIDNYRTWLPQAYDGNKGDTRAKEVKEDVPVVKTFGLPEARSASARVDAVAPAETWGTQPTEPQFIPPQPVAQEQLSGVDLAIAAMRGQGHQQFMQPVGYQQPQMYPGQQSFGQFNQGHYGQQSAWGNQPFNQQPVQGVRTRGHGRY